MNESDRATWIKLSDDGEFQCGECENEVKPLTNTAEGMVEANVQAIRDDLDAQPSKIIYGVCPVCGMEYVFKSEDGQLYLEPSNEEK